MLLTILKQYLNGKIYFSAGIRMYVEYGRHYDSIGCDAGESDTAGCKRIDLLS